MPRGRAAAPATRWSCADEVWSFPPASPWGRADLVIGPLDIVNGKALSRYTPASYGYRSYGHDGGRFYKVAVVVTVGATVTLTIAPPARGHVVIDLPGGGVTSVTYHSCARRAGGFFAQGFAFTHRLARGCVPLNLTIGNRPPVRHLTLSLFAGPCMTRPAAETAASS